MYIDLFINYARVKKYASKFKLNIKKSDLVLDIGSGNDPHPRADVLCDKYLFDNVQRIGETLVKDRPLVIGDAENLPFLDKSFDYIICSHLLEHLKHPEQCLKELMRVGKKGYIETPSELSEKLFGMSYHYWFVNKESETIILKPKSSPFFDETISSKFYGLLKNKAFLYFYWKNIELFFIKIEWNNTIHYRIIQEVNGIKFYEPLDCNLDEICNISNSITLKSIIKKIIRLYYKKKSVNIIDILACPVCKNKLILDADKHILVCSLCSVYYSYYNDIPILLKEKSLPLNK